MIIVFSTDHYPPSTSKIFQDQVDTSRILQLLFKYTVTKVEDEVRLKDGVD